MSDIWGSNVTFEPPEFTWDIEIPDYTVRNVFHLVVHILAFAFGVPGNCLILRVYWTKARKTSTHVLILALAWVDLTVCVLRIPVITSRALILSGDWTSWVNAYFVFSAVEGTAVVSSFLITGLVAVDRYDCICRSQKRLFTHMRGKIATLVALLCAFFLTLPGYLVLLFYSQTLGTLSWVLMSVSFLGTFATVVLCYGKVFARVRKHVKVCASHNDEPSPQDPNGVQLEHNLPLEQCTQPSAATCEMDSSLIDRTLSMFSNNAGTSSDGCTDFNLNNVPSSTVPCRPPQDVAGHLFLTPTTRQAMQDDVGDERKPSAKPGNGRGPAPQREGGAVLQRKTTRMLFIASAVFLLTWLPYLTCNILSVLADDPPVLLRDIVQNMQVALLINNVVNPLIYGFANRRFRKDCKEVLRKMNFLRCS
ncbi:gastrin/cholecystokinin type B receptor-like [Patiria miniata]|uniref:G-protein coupled receptors family 1 profile domain-containing protein n=1 Tax=Patiria miniata TaxID=46514 RepID=A0A914ADY4_PATMI|nr:gastrin/cholecystokinin type B receptor-like [Patiria miniata]